MLTWISQNFVFIAYANQKLWRKNLWGSPRPPPPPVTEGLMLSLKMISCNRYVLETRYLFLILEITVHLRMNRPLQIPYELKNVSSSFHRNRIYVHTIKFLWIKIFFQLHRPGPFFSTLQVSLEMKQLIWLQSSEEKCFLFLGSRLIV